MIQKFVALPVAGDAFFLQRERATILVDSGGNGKRLATLLNRHVPEVKGIDIAVCTHADSDHAGGFTTLLEHWCPEGGRKPAIGQFWLPGTWVDIVPDLLIRAKALADALIADLDKFADSSPDLGKADIPSEVVAEALDRRHGIGERSWGSGQDGRTEGRYCDEEQVDLETLGRVHEPEWMGELRERTEQIIRDATRSSSALRSARMAVIQRRKKREIGSGLADLWLSLIATASRIRSIALSAIKHRVKVRWFDYGEFEGTGTASGGIRGLLIPVNAVEVSSPPAEVSYYRVLRLSEANEQCLSFFAPAAEFGGSVLFCGDSPMGNGQNYGDSFPLESLNRARNYPLIVTAPHHGAESSASAYTHITARLKSDWLFWVRSGGQKTHPESSFRSIPQERRFCTHCPHLPLTREPVEFKMDSHMWPFLLLACRGHSCFC